MPSTTLADTLSDSLDDIVAASPSALVREVASLTERQRRMLGVTVAQLAMASVLFEVCSQLLDDGDERPLSERFGDLERLAQRFDELGIEKSLAEWAESADPKLPPWARRTSAPSFQKFLRRFVGAGRYDRVQAAWQTDGAVVFVAARRSVRFLLPMATAFDHIVGVMTPDQIAQIEGLSPIASSPLLEIAVAADTKLSDWLDRGAVVPPSVARPDELADLPGTLGELTEQLCGQISVRSADLIDELGTALSRKVRGAHDALRFSADPVSQAANSLIELIDRLLRQSFTDAEVLEWLTTWYTDDIEDLTHVHEGKIRPTKRAQALCFVHAGGEPPESTLIGDVSAAAIVAVRNQLQQLKHADHGTDAERDDIVASLVTIESVLLLVCNLAWLGAEEERLEKLKSRLSAA